MGVSKDAHGACRGLIAAPLPLPLRSSSTLCACLCRRFCFLGCAKPFARTLSLSGLWFLWLLHARGGGRLPPPLQGLSFYTCFLWVFQLAQTCSCVRLFCVGMSMFGGGFCLVFWHVKLTSGHMAKMKGCFKDNKALIESFHRHDKDHSGALDRKVARTSGAHTFLFAAFVKKHRTFLLTTFVKKAPNILALFFLANLPRPWSGVRADAPRRPAHGAFPC